MRRGISHLPWTLAWGQYADMITDFTAVPDWFPFQNAGAGLAVGDVDGDGRPDLVVFMVDAPDGQNAGYFLVGWGLSAAGAVTGGWSPWTPVPDWFSWANAGADVTVPTLTATANSTWSCSWWTSRRARTPATTAAARWIEPGR